MLKKVVAVVSAHPNPRHGAPGVAEGGAAEAVGDIIVAAVPRATVDAASLAKVDLVAAA